MTISYPSEEDDIPLILLRTDKLRLRLYRARLIALLRARYPEPVKEIPIWEEPSW